MTSTKLLLTLPSLLFSSLALAQTYVSEQGIRETLGMSIEVSCSGPTFSHPVTCELIAKEGKKDAGKKVTAMESNNSLEALTNRIVKDELSRAAQRRSSNQDRELPKLTGSDVAFFESIGSLNSVCWGMKDEEGVEWMWCSKEANWPRKMVLFIATGFGVIPILMQRSL